MSKSVKEYALNDVLHWFWKLLPLVLACGIIWNKVDTVEKMIEKLDCRVLRLESRWMNGGQHHVETPGGK